jgi:fructose-1-phosphate kinase PfkB-like protein
MRYTDYINLIKPRNSEFSEYVNRKMNNSDIGYDLSLSFGMNESTRGKFGKLF